MASEIIKWGISRVQALSKERDAINREIDEITRPIYQYAVDTITDKGELANLAWKLPKGRYRTLLLSRAAKLPKQ